MYSVGQVAARIRRHAATLRRLERDGHIPPPKMRSPQGYRLYSTHEVAAIEHAFKHFACSQGKSMPMEFAATIKTLFDKIHRHYDNKTHPLPSEVAHA